MATYDYRCRVCRNEFEVEHGITETPSVECPKCKVCASDRLVSTGSTFVLKGDGWAKDLYSGKRKEK